MQVNLVIRLQGMKNLQQRENLNEVEFGLVDETWTLTHKQLLFYRRLQPFEELVQLITL